jgi:hypothetical protein
MERDLIDFGDGAENWQRCVNQGVAVRWCWGRRVMRCAASWERELGRQGGRARTRADRTSRTSRTGKTSRTGRGSGSGSVRRRVLEVGRAVVAPSMYCTFDAIRVSWDFLGLVWLCREARSTDPKARQSHYSTIGELGWTVGREGGWKRRFGGEAVD